MRHLQTLGADTARSPEEGPGPGRRVWAEAGPVDVARGGAGEPPTDMGLDRHQGLGAERWEDLGSPVPRRTVLTCPPLGSVAGRADRSGPPLYGVRHEGAAGSGHFRETQGTASGHHHRYRGLR